MKNKTFIYTKRTYVVMVILVLSLLSGVISICYIYFYRNNKDILEHLSYIGQYLGGTAGVAFSVAAMMAVLLTVLAQIQQNRDQKKQIETQKEQIIKNEAREIKREFVNNFFQLLNSYDKIFSNITYSFPQGEKGGVDRITEIKSVGAFKEYYIILNDGDMRINKTRNEMMVKTIDESSKGTMLSLIDKLYKYFDDQFQPQIGNYFRIVYYILDFVDKDKTISKEDKDFYLKSFRAQISGYELLMIFYNCISFRGRDKLLPLTKKWNFFKNIEEVKDKLINIENVNHFDLYNLL